MNLCNYILWLALLLEVSPGLKAQSLIDRVEYFLDQDPGYGSATPLSITPLASINNYTLPLNPGIISTGLHTLHVRAKSNNGEWGLSQQVYLYKPYAVSGATTLSNLERIEYYLDQDPGYGSGTPVSFTAASQISNLVLALNPTNWSVGIHNLHLRARNQTGAWSHLQSVVFYKPYSTTTTTAANLQYLEYFLDQDPGLGLGTPVSFTPGSQVNNLIIPLNVSNVSVGIHTLHIRARNAHGQWSLLQATTFYKPYLPPLSTVQSSIQRVEYFIDQDPGLGQAIPLTFTPSTQVSNLIVPINTTPLSVCDHQFVLRALDASGKWSLMNQSTFTIPQTIGIKLFLQGYYQGGGSMRFVLNNQGIQSGPCPETDSVLVELRQQVSPYNVIHSYKGVLRTDGLLPCKFPPSIYGQSYYIVIKHRNTLPTWSATPVLMTSSTVYDFTDSPLKTYGQNVLQLEPGIWGLYSGDILPDQNIDLLDLSEEENSIALFDFGYMATDINGDGNVDLLDLPVLENNINQFIYTIQP